MFTTCYKYQNNFSSSIIRVSFCLSLNKQHQENEVKQRIRDKFGENKQVFVNKHQHKVKKKKITENCSKNFNEYAKNLPQNSKAWFCIRLKRCEYFCIYVFKETLQKNLYSYALPLKKTAVFQIVLNNNISDSVKDKLNVLGVCGTGEMGVDLLGVLLLVQVFKFALDVSCSLLVIVKAYETQCLSSIWEKTR